MEVGTRHWLLACVAVLASCGRAEEDEDWDCYVHTDTMVCECFSGVGEYGGTDVDEVEACDSYPRCYAYLDEFFEEPTCSCGDENHSPDTGSLEVREVDSCPE